MKITLKDGSVMEFEQEMFKNEDVDAVILTAG